MLTLDRRALTLMVFEKPGWIRRSEMVGELTEGYCMNMISLDTFQLMSKYSTCCNGPDGAV